MKPLWITGHDEVFRPMAEKHFFDSVDKLGLRNEFDFEFHHLGAQYGTFGEKLFNASYFKELENIKGVLYQNLGRIVVWSDVDMRIYRSPMADISEFVYNADLSCSMDSPVGVEPVDHCTGFQFFYVTQKLLNFYNLWLDVDKEQEWSCSQVSFNEALRRSNLTVRRLPDRYWTIGLEGQKVWNGRNLDDIPSPPKDLVLHHANYTIGVGNKMRLLDEVKERVSK